MRRCVTLIWAGTDSRSYPHAPMRKLGAFLRLGKSLPCTSANEIVENNSYELSKRDIKPLQMAVFPRF